MDVSAFCIILLGVQSPSEIVTMMLSGNRRPQLWAALMGAAAATGPFLSQIDNSTWIFGNDYWNMTQGPNYGTKLFSTILPDQDLVGSAWGHYSDIGMSHTVIEL